MIPTVLDHVEKLTDVIYTFWFRPSKRVRYDAGQFTEIHLPHDSDERKDKRWFTLSSSPTEELLAITTKFSDKPSSFKSELQRLKPDDEILLAEPMGDFVLPKDTSIPLVFIAAGIGITPVRSMLKMLSDTGEQRIIQVIYRAPENERIFTDIIQASGELTMPDVRPDYHYLSQLLGGLQDKRIYISGPEKMAESLQKDLIKNGVSTDEIVTDYFHGYDSV